MSRAAAIYDCRVMHRRHRGAPYVFDYRLFSLLVDIDRLDELDRLSPLFSVDRFNLFSLRRQDHLGAGASDLREWADRTLAEQGIDGQGLHIRLLCMPRVLGWVFNPLSIWYCQDDKGRPVAVICEVRNTFGERHCYLLQPSEGQADWPLRASHAKQFHVSPFLPVSGEYHFSLHRPGSGLRISILETDARLPVLSATQQGERQPFTTRGLLVRFFLFPLQTAKVLGAIHWHALKIWLRRVPFYKKPQAPIKEVS